MDKKCLRCQKKLRPCKSIDTNREHHLSCLEKIQKEEYEKTVEKFVSWFKEQGIIVRI